MACPTKKVGETEEDFKKRQTRQLNDCRKKSRFVNRSPSPGCRCKRQPRGIEEYTLTAPVQEINYGRFIKKVRPSPDGSPVPGSSAGGRNRAAHYEYKKDASGNYQKRSDGSDESDESKVNALFPIKNGTILHDGAGNERGKIASGKGAATGSPLDTPDNLAVEINYGQSKTISGIRYVYAFSCEYEYDAIQKDSNPPIIIQAKERGSGWIRIDSIIDFIDVVGKMIPIKGKKPDTEDKKHYKKCTIKAGNNKYGDLKVNPCIAETNQAASDYLERKEAHIRPGQTQEQGVVNITYNRKIATDTVPIGTVFYRLDEDRTPEPVRVPLFEPCSHIVKSHMTFVYGFVQDEVTKKRRYGWIAQATLKC